MNELRKIALGEFMDDLDLSSKINSFFGIEKEAGAEEQKVGEDRLGSTSIFASFGATMLIGSIVFAGIIVVIVLLVVNRKKLKVSDKVFGILNKIKQKIFWNAIIRYLFLNYLKLNMSSFVVLKAA